MDDPEVPRALVRVALPPAAPRPVAMPHALIRSVAAKAGVPKHNYSLLWLVRDALSAPMPPGWEACADGEGWTNVERGETVKSHPCLSYLRRAIAKETSSSKGTKEDRGPPAAATRGGKKLRPSSGRSGAVRLGEGIKLGDVEEGGHDYGLRRGGPWLECTEPSAGGATAAALITYWYHFGQRKRLNEHPALWLARRRGKATTEVQRHARGMLARRARCNMEECAAAIVLQSVYRSLAARYFAKNKRCWKVEAKSVAAAVQFQKVWRGRWGRRRAAKQRLVVWEAEEQRSATAIQLRWRVRSAGRHDAAAALQARWRGVEGRRAVQARRAAIENEAWRRKCAAEEEAKRRVEAEARAKVARAEKARKIAEAAAAAEAAEAEAEAERLRIAALYAENRRREEERHAASSLQAKARGWLCREDLKRQRCAVARLQAVVRGDILRRERRGMVGAATRLQAQRRGQLGRRARSAREVEVQQELERTSSMLLQSAARRWLGQRDTAAAALQARWRGRGGRRRAVKRRQKVERRAQRAAEAKARAEDFRRAALDALDLGDPVGNLALRSAKYSSTAAAGDVAGAAGIGAGARGSAAAAAAAAASALGDAAGGREAGMAASSSGGGGGPTGLVAGVRSGAVSALGALEGEPARRAATTGGLGLRNRSGNGNVNADWRPDGRTKELAQTDMLPKFGQLDGGRRFAALRSVANYGLGANAD